MEREVVVVECEMDRQPGIPDSVATRSDDVALVVFDSAAPPPPPPPPIPPSGDKGTLKLAYKTLGVVFGGLVTSPLYVYPSMRLKSPTEDDYLGIYSIMFWTLSLIGVVKYACIALRADDQGEGGTFALYSLLCRNLDIGILSSKCVALNSSSEKRSRLGIFFEKSVVARRVLLFIAMLGMCMLISDGILTPAISVLSAMDGIRAPFPSVSKCSEALFADLGHFNRKSIQLAFLFTIYPSLVLTYAGQTAYLIKNPNDHDDGFYKFIPKTIYWPMFIIATLAAIVASQSLISATFSIIKQSVTLDYFPRVKVVHTSSKKEGEVYCPEINYILMILCVAVILIFGDGKDIGNAFGVVVSLVMLITTILLTLVMIMIWRTPPALVALYFVVYFVMEGVYVSAVSTKILQGGWIPFAISFILAFIMFGWFHGRHRKIQYELSHKIDRDQLRMLLSDPIVQRVPGVCLFYTSIQDGVTPILGHYIKNMKSLHKVTIFTTFRCLLVPRVAPHKRIVVSKLGLKGVYRCVVQYGYANSLDLEGDDFVSHVIDRLRAHIQNGSDYATSVTSELEEEMSDMEEAKLSGAVHVQGKTRFYVSKNCGWFDGYMLAFYEVLHRNCRSALPAMGVPLLQRVEVGMLYEV
ncbi:probable potassium transporter 17 isoform X2 [Camellia sinensis]|uniref:probable potassium transporter 17 isoform X2 n=1 Tax=Camellia sinensis TaxID=4442 RepID=UPI001035CB04|nr:probable potassium transporter 17 isoform X2 [Camellia sinensis]